MAVAIQRANATVLRVTRTATLSINQLYFASMMILLCLWCTPRVDFGPSGSASTDIYGREAKRFRDRDAVKLREASAVDELLYARDEPIGYHVVGAVCSDLFIK